MQPPVPSHATGASALTPPTGPPSRPRMFNGATVHGIAGIRALRHPAGIPMLIAAILTTAAGYGMC